MGEGRQGAGGRLEKCGAPRASHLLGPLGKPLEQGGGVGSQGRPELSLSVPRAPEGCTPTLEKLK